MEEVIPGVDLTAQVLNVVPVSQGVVKCYAKVDWVVVVWHHSSLDGNIKLMMGVSVVEVEGHCCGLCRAEHQVPPLQVLLQCRDSC